MLKELQLPDVKEYKINNKLLSINMQELVYQRYKL